MKKLFSYYFLLVFLIFAFIHAVKIPSELPVCHKSDPEFNNCVARAMEKALRFFQNGSKELGIPRLEPYYFPKLEMHNQPGGSVTLNQKFENMYTYGITISDIYEASFEMTDNKCYWSMWVLTPNVRTESDFEVTGKVLMFPINGKGKATMTIKNLRNHHQAYCTRVEKNGKTYLKFSKYTQDMSIDAIHYDFPNLIPGNAKLSESVLNTLNENSLEIFKEVKYGFEEIWGLSHLQAVNSVFSKIPENEAFLD